VTDEAVVRDDSRVEVRAAAVSRFPWSWLSSRFATGALLRNSIVIMATTVVTSLFGGVFWWVVARNSTAQESGAGAAAVSALQATAIFAAVGAATAMIEWLPRSRSSLEWRRRFTAGVVVAATGGCLGGLLVVAVLGHLLDTLPALRSFTGAVLFCSGAVFFAVGTVYDYAAIAECRGAMMLGRNALFTAARIPLMLVPWLLPGTGDQILTAWTAAAGLSLLIALAGFRRSTFGNSLRPQWRGLAASLREMRKSLLSQHFVTIAAMMGSYLLPIMVVVRVSAAANAYFYATWMIGAIFFMISPAVSTALFAACSGNLDAVGSAVRRSAVTIAALLVVPMAVCLLGGGVLLSLFGPDYPREGRLLLVLLTLSAIPDGIANIAVAVLRATNRVRGALWLNTTMLVASLVLSWVLLPSLGIVAVGVSWLAAQTAGALWVVLRWRRIIAGAGA
jgi:O-antigen/teichoic acid export membrane protein